MTPAVSLRAWRELGVGLVGPVRRSDWLSIQTEVQILSLVNSEKFPLSVGKLRKQVWVAMPGLHGTGPSPLHGAEQPVHQAPRCSQSLGQNGGERGAPTAGYGVEGQRGGLYRLPSRDPQNSPLLLGNLASPTPLSTAWAEVLPEDASICETWGQGGG